VLEECGRHWRRLAGAAGAPSAADLARARAEEEAQAQELRAMLGEGPSGADVRAVAEELTRHIPHLAPSLEISGLDG
jgi:hypothetical protein